MLNLPISNHLILRHARVPGAVIDTLADAPRDADGFVQVDLELKDGLIAGIAAAGMMGEGIDLKGRQVWPGLIDSHTHLDKCHIWPRAVNPDGDFPGALDATLRDRQGHWNYEDIYRRFDFGLRCAYAHGTVAIRTHLDCFDAQEAQVSWKVFRDLRDAWSDRIDLQAVSIQPVEYLSTDEGPALVRLIAESGGVLGAVTATDPGHGRLPDGYAQMLDRLFKLATAHSLDIDLHVDESGDLGATALREIALASLRNNFRGKVVCGHCCSLSLQSEEFIRQTLSLCADAGISVVSLPACNMFLQDRQRGRTPRWRGVTLVHEFAANGIPVAVASDNCRDPFFGFGDHDMLDIFNHAVRIAHLDTNYADWVRAATVTPANAMRLEHRGRIARGMPADLVLFQARFFSELLSRPQSDRIVLRSGKPVSTTLPDYAELDEIVL